MPFTAELKVKLKYKHKHIDHDPIYNHTLATILVEYASAVNSIKKTKLETIYGHLDFNCSVSVMNKFWWLKQGLDF